MKTRRNRRGGANSFLSGLFGTAQPTQPAQPTSAQPLQEPTPTQPMPDGKEMSQAMVSPEAQVLIAPTPAEKRSGSIAIDNAASELYHLEPQFQNYHMRGIINAIGVCNSSEKAGNNLTGTFEVSECGPACKVRSEKVKAALTELLRIGKDNDALGYIGSGRVAANSAGYFYNSGKSVGRRLGFLPPREPATATQVGPVVQAQPITGGRRRTRRRR